MGDGRTYRPFTAVSNLGGAWANASQMGAGALGATSSATGASRPDVTLIECGREHRAIRSRGLELDGVTPEEKSPDECETCTTEVQSLTKQKPSTSRSVGQSYDTEWATLLYHRISRLTATSCRCRTA